MFERLVHKLILDHIGIYIKNIHKDQLKVDLWRAQIELRDVELNLQVFDDLQLPFSVKKGRVGKLCVKVPWKRLGRDPIFISLENVYVRACERDDHEWNADSVKRREYAAKKAKLSAAEISMLSKCVSDTQTGKSFIPYITAKILDGIQVSFRDVHISITNKEMDSEKFAFGLRFSSLTMERSCHGEGNQVIKIIDIMELGIYCNTSEGTLDLLKDNVTDCKLYSGARVATDIFDYMLEPCDVLASLEVNLSGNFVNGAPQYSVSVELTTLALKLNENQMQKILALLDYLGTCQLREKYGDYRPYSSTLQSKPEGWQKMWWRYAQESVLSDVRKRLQKTSWMHLGWRLSQRRKYVNLYKRKLNFIREEQLVDSETLWELEQMEKESDIDDILSYRSFAERESQEILRNANPLSVGKFSSKARAEGKQINISPSSRSRGWIKWLSLGILGDDGTEDSINLSGAVSDEIVKDIYEATQSRATSSVEEDKHTTSGIYLFSIECNVHEISVTLLSKSYDKDIIKVTLDEANVLFKLWEKSWNLVTSINSVKIEDLCANKVILLKKELTVEQNTQIRERPFFTFEVDMFSVNLEPEMKVQLVLEPFEVTYESDILLNLWSFYLVLGSFQSQSQRVLSSINGFENNDIRLSSKAEYIIQRRTKVTWDASVSCAIINFPWRYEDTEFVMVVELESLTFRTRTEAESPASVSGDLLSTPYSDKFTKVHLQDLYDHFEIILTNFEVNVRLPGCNQATSVVDQFSASLRLASCIIPESTIKQLEVHFSVPSLCVHFSPSIYGALLGFVSCLDVPKLKSEPEGAMCSATTNFCFNGYLKRVSINANIEDAVEKSLGLLLDLGEVEILCDAQQVMDFWICSKTIQLSTHTSRGDSSGHLLCSSRSLCTTVHEPRIGVEFGLQSGLCGDQNQTAGECLLLHYRAPRSLATCSKNYYIRLTGLDLHIYPSLVGLLCRFIDQLSGYGTASSVHSPKDVLIPTSQVNDTVLKCSSELRSFGFSNFCEVGSTAQEELPVEQFPFVTIHNSGSLGCLEQSLKYAIPEWRNSFVLRDGKSARRSTLRTRKRSTISDEPILKPLSCIDLLRESEDSYCCDYDINLNLRGVEVYFHDSSCILGTLTLPFCKSTFNVHGSECMDIMCSADGLLLSSELASKKFSDFLWGPSEQNISPILNLRLRKNHVGALNQNFEISISVQHVHCVLPSEYLSILIGYFSLPDWSPYGHEKDLHRSAEHKNVNNCDNIFKIEILASMLLLPLECNRSQALQLEIPETYISFTSVNHMDDVLRNIPLDCVVQTEMIVDTVRLLNVFGRSLCLSLLQKDDLSSNIDEGLGHISLISELDLDLWIRIPSDSAPTCIMVKISDGEVNAEDDYFLLGVEGVLNVTGEFSTVGRDSECFTSNVYQFLELKKNLEHTSISDNASCVSIKEVACCVNHLSVKTYRSRIKESISSILVAQVDMSFKLSASFRDDTPLNLDVVFSSLELHSCHSRVILVQCKSDSSVSSVVGIHLAQLNRPNEVVVDLPSIHIWLHLSDWCEFIELLQSFSEHLEQTSLTKASTTNSTITEECFPLSLMSENIVVSFHYPLTVKEDVKIDQDVPLEFSSDVLGESMIKGKYWQYVTLVLLSRECKLSVCGSHAELTCRIEEFRGTLDTLKDKTVLSQSFFQLLQVSVVVICDNRLKRHVSVDLLVDSVSMCVSHQLFLVWHCLGFNPESESSHHSSISMDLKMQLRRAYLLLTDETYPCNGAVLEVLFSNLVLHSDITRSAVEASLGSDLLVNYFNIEKAAWEPFIETWKCLLSMTKAHKQSSHLNASVVTDIHLKSSTQLNMNLTEPVIEVIFRLNEFFKNLWSYDGLDDLHGTQKLLGGQTTSSLYKRRFAPYLFQNETSMPILIQLPLGLVIEDDLGAPSARERNVVYPGSSVCIFPDEVLEEQLSCLGGHQPRERLIQKKSHGMGHHMISIQLDGASEPSKPISMDNVGLSYVEIHFPEVLQKEALARNECLSKPRKETEEYSNMDASSGFVVPMVFDVSTLHYRKVIRVYSTVMLVNRTSIPLEIWFDTPFSISSKVLEQIYPGQKFPLPLHVVEGGFMRWRPLNSTFLWSEAHPVSKVVTRDTKLGSFRSFVCYPCHSTSDPFRCCLSVERINLPSATGECVDPFVRTKESVSHSVGNSDQLVCSPKNLKMPPLHIVTLTTPLLVRNYMPVEVSLTAESGGVSRTVLISQDHCVAISHIDSTNDLGLVFHIRGFNPTITKFPSAEAFASVARFHDNKFSQSETMTFYPDSSNIPMNVTVEKTVDALCGARTLSIFVGCLLYNCTGLSITVAQVGDEAKCSTFPPCDELIEMDQHLSREHSPVLLRSKQESHASPPNICNIWSISSAKKPTSSPDNHHPGKSTGSRWPNSCQVSLRNLKTQKTSFQTRFTAGSENGTHLYTIGSITPKACMYFPRSTSTSSGVEHMVKLSVCMPNVLSDSKKRVMWSNPFNLVPSGGSSCVIVPLVNTSAAYMLSATSIPLAGPLSGRTSAFIFQPRYVIRNTCSRGICYKQKGTKLRSHLGVGEQSHLHWADTTRELLVSLAFDGPGWLLSGSFSPDHLGDTQIKMRNENGTLSIVRVGVQNADVITGDEIVVESPSGTSATLLILLSDDVTGFMPYRIDNFSMETLRIYQDKCETFEKTVRPYSSCPYIWDEPCYPHRVVIEVIGECVLGSFSLDDVMENTPICLPSTSELRRHVVLSIHADGAVKVLNIFDSSCLPKEMKDIDFPGIKEKTGVSPKEETFIDYCGRISFDISSIGVSIISSYPEELIFASAKGIKVDLLQSVETLNISFQISSLQVDNQLNNSTYPVILYLGHDLGSTSACRMKNKDSNNAHISSKGSCQPVFLFSAKKLRNTEAWSEYFEYVVIKLADVHLELEEEVMLRLFSFSRNVMLNTQSSLDFPEKELSLLNFPRDQEYPSLLSEFPNEDFPREIHFLARRQNKIYVKLFDLSHIKLTLSFSSTPCMYRNEDGVPAGLHRVLMALADVEGATVHLKQLRISDYMGTSKSFQEIFTRHYSPQLLHKMYKIVGSASVIGNPMEFAKNLRLGVINILSVSRGLPRNPSGLFAGMAEGTLSLCNSFIYAMSNTTTQFSKSVNKALIAFTYEHQTADSHNKGVVSELLEDLTGLLQSPIKGAEERGLPGFLSGAALGTARLVTRPVASFLSVTEKIAKSIKKRSNPHHSPVSPHRMPRHLIKGHPLQSFTEEGAIAKSVLQSEDLCLKSEKMIMCMKLKEEHKYFIITEKLVLVVTCANRDLNSPQWEMEVVVRLDDITYIDREVEQVMVVSIANNSRVDLGLTDFRTVSIGFAGEEEGKYVLEVLGDTCKFRKERGLEVHVMHRNGVRINIMESRGVYDSTDSIK